MTTTQTTDVKALESQRVLQTYRRFPVVFTRGEGPYLFDVDGNRLIDYYCGMGAMVLGHSPAAVQQAVKDQVDKGILYAGQSEIEFEAAKILCKHIPSAQRLRFGSSGSEVAQAAFRLAKTSSPRPVSRKDLRLERTIGQPLPMPLAMLPPASSSSWVTVRRTMFSYSSISNVTRL